MRGVLEPALGNYGSALVIHYTSKWRPASEGKPQNAGIVSEYANSAALLFEQNGVAGPHLTGREDRRVNSRALPVLLNDAFQNFWT